MIFVDKEHINITPISIASAVNKLNAAYKLELLCAYIAKNPSENFSNPLNLIEFDLGGFVTKVNPYIEESLKKENLSIIGNHFSSFIKYTDFNKRDWEKVINGTLLSRNFHFTGTDDIEVSPQCVFELVSSENNDIFASKVIFSIFVKK